jgi:hypothetical protein
MSLCVLLEKNVLSMLGVPNCLTLQVCTRVCVPHQLDLLHVSIIDQMARVK